MGKREIICLSLHCHHQNDFCIKVGSHFNVSLIVWDKVTRQCPQTTTFDVKGEPKQIRTEDPLLTSLTAGPNRLTARQCKATQLYILLFHQLWVTKSQRHTERQYPKNQLLRTTKATKPPRQCPQNQLLRTTEATK